MPVRSVAVRLSAEVSGYIAGMRSAGKATKDALGDATKYASEHEKSLTKVGNTAGKIGLVAAAGLGAIVGATANFDKQMSAVQAATHETADNMDQLREAAIQAGADTAFSASEAAAGIENLAKAGVNTTEVLGGGLQGALDLAAAGGMEVADAAEAAAGAMAQFKLQGEDVPHIADLLAAGAGKAQGEVSDMVMALKQAGTVSAQTGLSLEETVGALSAMAEQSLLGSDAGTSFKTMLAALTPNSDKAAKAMETYNIHAFDAQGNFVGLTELAGQLRDGLGDLTDEQRAMTLETIFGSDAVRAASIIYDNGADGISKWIGQVDDAGFAAETAGIKMDNLSGDVEALKGSLERALIGSGEGSQGMLRGLVKGATDAVNVFNDLPPAAQSVTTGLLGITAVTGGGLWFGTKVVQSVASTREALENLNISGGKVKGTMKGLAAAGLGLAALNVGAAAIRAIQDATDETLPGLETLTNRLLNVNTVGLGSEFDSIGESLRRLNDDSKTFEERWGDLAFGQLGKVSSLFGGPDGVAGSVREATAEIDALDQALANIAQQAGPEKAMQVFRDFAAAQNLTVSQQRDLLGLLPGLENAMASTANSTELAGGAADKTAAAVDGLGGAMDAASYKTWKLDEAMAGLFAGLDADAALDAWRDNIQELSKALEGGADALDGMTKKGRENRADIRESISALRDRAEAEYEETGNLKLLQKRLFEGRDAIIKQAEAAGIGEDAMVAYLRQLGFTPKEIRTAVTLMGTPEAQAEAAQVQSALDKLAKTRPVVDIKADASQALRQIAAVNYARIEDKSFTITTYYDAMNKDANTANFAPPPKQKATGGAVFGPGTTTSDSIPALLSNDEHVWSAAEVAGAGGHQRVERLRYLARSGQLQGFATGGALTRPGGGFRQTATVAVSSSVGGSAVIDYDRLTRAMLQARPLYGDQYVMPHNYDQFRREQEADRRAASLDGVR